MEVQTGISDNDYIEIISGLQDGDTIAYIPPTASTTNSYEQMMREEMQGEPENDGGPSGESGGGPQG